MKITENFLKTPIPYKINKAKVSFFSQRFCRLNSILKVLLFTVLIKPAQDFIITG